MTLPILQFITGIIFIVLSVINFYQLKTDKYSGNIIFGHSDRTDLFTTESNLFCVNGECWQMTPKQSKKLGKIIGEVATNTNLIGWNDKTGIKSSFIFIGTDEVFIKGYKNCIDTSCESISISKAEYEEYEKRFKKSEEEAFNGVFIKTCPLDDKKCAIAYDYWKKNKTSNKHQSFKNMYVPGYYSDEMKRGGSAVFLIGKKEENK